MTQMTSYEPGTPSWIDLTAPDVDAAVAFYGGLFDWQADEAGSQEETHGYRTFRKNGEAVAGVFNPGGELPAAWTTYVSVDDADQAAALAADAGGKVMAGPMDVMNSGRMAVFSDPEGAAIAVWQPKEHVGAGLVNEHGTLTWNELRTRDTETAKEFYGTVFGWKGLESEQMGDYTVWAIGDAPPEQGKGGMIDMAAIDMPDDVPPHWDVNFAVDDADATAERCAELGGRTLAGPIEIPMGRMYALQDPGGAKFTVITFAQ